MSHWRVFHLIEVGRVESCRTEPIQADVPGLNFQQEEKHRMTYKWDYVFSGFVQQFLHTSQNNTTKKKIQKWIIFQLENSAVAHVAAKIAVAFWWVSLHCRLSFRAFVLALDSVWVHRPLCYRPLKALVTLRQSTVLACWRNTACWALQHKSIDAVDKERVAFPPVRVDRLELLWRCVAAECRENVWIECSREAFSDQANFPPLAFQALGRFASADPNHFRLGEMERAAVIQPECNQQPESNDEMSIIDCLYDRPRSHSPKYPHQSHNSGHQTATLDNGTIA